MGKIGRNDPCPCGSGKKFKKCHGLNGNRRFIPINKPKLTAKEMDILKRKAEAIELQKQNQQGKGNPIIAAHFNEGIVVGLGNKLYHYPQAKTFHDVLMSYPSSILSSNWLNTELKKDDSKKNLIAYWYKVMNQQLQANQGNENKINSMPMTGAIQSYLNLSWNLFLIQNNSELQKYLIKRLKQSHGPTFQGVLYETYVAAAFIKAGFKIEFEDESDSTTTHGEFIATHDNGEQYLVEAKAKQPNSNINNFTHNLKKALEIETNLKRIILIELNLPSINDDISEQILTAMYSNEENITINGKESPPAYVFFSNHPAQHNLSTIPQPYAFFCNGFKIRDFPAYLEHLGGQKYVQCKERDKPLYDLIDSLKNHHEIPTTLNGELPEFTLFKEKDDPARLIIGHNYNIGTDEAPIEGKLMDGIVDTNKKIANCVMQTNDGKSLIYTFPLTNKEVQAYKRSPSTFFGAKKEVSDNNIKTPSDFFDWLYGIYSQSPKKTLIDLLCGLNITKNFDELSQKDLAIIYCESLTNSMRANLTYRLPPK